MRHLEPINKMEKNIELLETVTRGLQEIVQNMETITRQVQEIQKQLEELYRTNIETLETIDQLLTKIRKYAEALLQEKLPETWEKIRKILEEDEEIGEE